MTADDYAAMVNAPLSDATMKSLAEALYTDGHLTRRLKITRTEQDATFNAATMQKIAEAARDLHRNRRLQPCGCIACEITRVGIVEGLRPWIAPWKLKLVEEDLKAIEEQR